MRAIALVAALCAISTGCAAPVATPMQSPSPTATASPSPSPTAVPTQTRSPTPNPTAGLEEFCEAVEVVRGIPPLMSITSEAVLDALGSSDQGRFEDSLEATLDQLDEVGRAVLRVTESALDAPPRDQRRYEEFGDQTFRIVLTTFDVLAAWEAAVANRGDAQPLEEASEHLNALGPAIDEWNEAVDELESGCE